MPIFLSEELNLGNRMDRLGVFDPLMDRDSNYFINIIRLRDTTVPDPQQDDKNGVNAVYP